MVGVKGGRPFRKLYDAHRGSRVIFWFKLQRRGSAICGMVRDRLALTFLIGSSYMKWQPSLLSVLLFVIISSTFIPNAQAQAGSGLQNATSETSVTDDPHGEHANERWEDPLRGKAFSEFAHHFAGSLEVIFGLAELGHAIGIRCRTGLASFFPVRSVWSEGSRSFEVTVTRGRLAPSALWRRFSVKTVR